MSADEGDRTRNLSRRNVQGHERGSPDVAEGPRRQIRHGNVRLRARGPVNRFHGSRQGSRQTVLHLAQHHPHARLHLSVAEVPGEDELPEQFRPRRGRHGADGRRHRRFAQTSRRHRSRRQHHRDLHHRQWRRSLHLARRRHDAVPRHQGHRVRRRLPLPCIARWPGKIKPGTVENGIFSGLDWLPTLVAAAGNPNIVEQLLQGVQLGDRTYKIISTATTRRIC